MSTDVVVAVVSAASAVMVAGIGLAANWARGAKNAARDAVEQTQANSGSTLRDVIDRIERRMLLIDERLVRTEREVVNISARLNERHGH